MAFDLRKMCIILACTTLTGVEDRLRLNNAQIKINLDNFGCVFGLHYLCTLKK